MNAREQLKPKSIRLAILTALSDGSITTIDDLQIKVDETRKKVANAVYPATVEGLIRRLRDDVTSGVAYQITVAGRAYLQKYSGATPEPVDADASAENAAPQGDTAATEAKLGLMPGYTFVEQQEAEIVRLNGVLSTVRAELELARLARATDHAGYVIQRPAKPLVRFVKVEKATARALAFARGGQRAQVFALVPVGAAIPGAEWVSA